MAKFSSKRLSSKFEFDSDLFCEEKFFSWDWLTKAPLTNSIITQICFTQIRFEYSIVTCVYYTHVSNFDSSY